MSISARWLAVAARTVVVLVVLWLLGEQLFFAIQRLPEPYPLRWLETYLFRSAYEAYRGGALFGEPSLEYIAPIYQPLYFLVGGLGFRLFDPGFLVLRTISFATFLGCVAVAFLWLRRSGHTRTSALAFASLGFLVPRAINDWVTTANLDAPFFLFVLAGLALVRFESPRRGAVLLAAALMFLGFALKQQALPFAAAAGLCLALESRRRFLEFALLLGGLIGVWLLACHISSDGWSTRTAVVLPLQSATSPSFDFADWTLRRLPLAAVAFGLGLGGILAAGTRALRIHWLAVGAAVLLVTWLSGRKEGGTINNLLPYLLLSFVAAGEAWIAVRRRGWLAARWVQPLALVVVCAILGAEARQTHRQNTLLRNAHAAAPGPSAYRRIESFEQRLVEALLRYDGPVFVGGRARSLVEEGRPVTNFHQTALYEGTVRADLYDVEAILGQALRSQRFDALFVWRREEEIELRGLLAESYEVRGQLGRDPLIGLEVEIWEPR